MKKLLILLLYVCSLVTSCYDDSFLNQRVDDLYDRVSTLEERCYQMNEDILALQSIVFALQDNDYITSVTSIKEGGVEIGYTLISKNYYSTAFAPRCNFYKINELLLHQTTGKNNRWRLSK